jgi:hypothetical protein
MDGESESSRICNKTATIGTRIKAALGRVKALKVNDCSTFNAI